MSKVKRSVLKRLIKECLVEILIEGLESEPGVEALVEAVGPRPVRSNSRSRQEIEMERIDKQRKMLDAKKVQSPINENIINEVSSDPIMADIFRDTASTTLQSQGLSNNAGPGMHRAHGGDQASKIVANNKLEDLFEGAQNWASLAFQNDVKK